MEAEVLVKVEGVSKKFCKDLRTGLWYGVQDLFSNFLGNKHERKLREKEFWALQDINFELKRGECLGLIGHNGAGKSTLLKILNGLINPDAGKVTIKGRVGALIELGAGFNPILTGRENIYNNGAILGFSRREIDEKLEEIIAYAELSEFIDMPVQHYSSGMRVRLGFAIAAQMEPDVLLIDEVLAVGDLGFMLKCFKTIDQILPSTAIIFVSHSMPRVSRLCNEIILLENGNAKYQGKDIAAGIDLYYDRFLLNDKKMIFTDGTMELLEVQIISEKSSKREEIPVINWGGNLELVFTFNVLKKIQTPRLVVSIFDIEQKSVAVLEKKFISDASEINKGTLNLRIIHQNIQFSKGIYSLNIGLIKANSPGPIVRYSDFCKFQVLHDEDVWEPFILKTEY
ncbi:ABC transporter ATP-binding protein [Christiangramia fulva]|uniref:ABC transporter ATP-binding protein n=1 Tax=Christiangramia fulva TaxID=2126553 RepID=A0A2R3ZAG7_9FLAO|nr:ABC transporter ATP-binding protein [Christiangramia fulva]